MLGTRPRLSVGASSMWRRVGFGGNETELVFWIRRDQDGAKDDGGRQEAQGSDFASP